MKIAVLGTGTVGQALAGKLSALGYEVVVGTRNVAETMSRTGGDRYGGSSFSAWHAEHKMILLKDFTSAAAFGEILFNATQGIHTVNALTLAGETNLNGKVLIDISNPLDFSKGMPPVLIPGLCNTHSLGEEIQRLFPGVKVVKALNTMWCEIMVKPSLVGGGDHQVFMCGNDAGAKAKTAEILWQFGWQKSNLIDLGDLTAARGMEMILPLWLKIMGTIGNGAFNLKVVK